MNKYTDEQLKRIAFWLGFKLEFLHSKYLYLSRYVGERLFMEIGDNVLWKEFSKWLLSAEGRCAIEDKFMQIGENPPIQFICGIDSGDPSVGIPRVYVVDMVDNFNYKNNRHLGWADNPNEAWLNAAITFTENKNE